MVAGALARRPLRSRSVWAVLDVHGRSGSNRAGCAGADGSPRCRGVAYPRAAALSPAKSSVVAATARVRIWANQPRRSAGMSNTSGAPGGSSSAGGTSVSVAGGAPSAGTSRARASPGGAGRGRQSWSSGLARSSSSRSSSAPDHSSSSPGGSRTYDVIRLPVRHEATISDGWLCPATRSASTCTAARASCPYAKLGGWWVPGVRHNASSVGLRRKKLLDAPAKVRGAGVGKAGQQAGCLAPRSARPTPTSVVARWSSVRASCQPSPSCRWTAAARRWKAIASSACPSSRYASPAPSRAIASRLRSPSWR